MADCIAQLKDASLSGEVEAAILAQIGGDGPDDIGLAGATTRQNLHAARRAVSQAEPDQHEWRRKLAYGARALLQHSGENGMGSLTLVHNSTDTEVIYHRFGLLARSQCSAEDDRTMQQQVADLVLAVLKGEVEPVHASAPSSEAHRPVSTSELEDGSEVKLLAGLRGAGAQINITMTLGTVAGFSDQPGVLQSGAVIPASLARQIAYQPDSTWYRMITDEVGRMIELSPRGYRPGAALSRTVRAEHMTCTLPGCRRPADYCELDHAKPFPTGETRRHNLHSACKRHHQGKTTGRFHAVKHAGGSVTWRYPTGHTYSTPAPRQPVDRWCGDWISPSHCRRSRTASQHCTASGTSARNEPSTPSGNGSTTARWKRCSSAGAASWATTPPRPTTTLPRRRMRSTPRSWRWSSRPRPPGPSVGKGCHI